MAKIVWTEPALSDLNDIAEYIALNNITAAKTLVQNVFKSVERLEDFPSSGRIPPELQHLSYREVIVPPCRIFYKQDNSSIYILFVMREERDLRKFILDRSLS
ncbi:type II toxin-antitoxin system RelE/ParE family toxin [Parashewanella spongiae]|uniref:Type II toxin-antitoxin system RelE/ParE family toxin n=1 Tax=Parashewanella spongiae TaxID=342950 RepID=A0A3A6T248_9GAMM|nr:type II toxin-antitoxin system RelE/ParE family toxin [Parashewanella spongiae]MCL1080205.1 type II toxin-antitoxin system RelE/ParE family toxin [Parashewanella spongiae]RJY02339.1 type II toxin-antitoxin system RelE/ParE family toxin [Parashewanella spongiae]